MNTKQSEISFLYAQNRADNLRCRGCHESEVIIACYVDRRGLILEPVGDDADSEHLEPMPIIWCRNCQVFMPLTGVFVVDQS